MSTNEPSLTSHQLEATQGPGTQASALQALSLGHPGSVEQRELPSLRSEPPYRPLLLSTLLSSFAWDVAAQRRFRGSPLLRLWRDGERGCRILIWKSDERPLSTAALKTDPVKLPLARLIPSILAVGRAKLAANHNTEMNTDSNAATSLGPNSSHAKSTERTNRSARSIPPHRWPQSEQLTGPRPYGWNKVVERGLDIAPPPLSPRSSATPSSRGQTEGWHGLQQRGESSTRSARREFPVAQPHKLN